MKKIFLCIIFLLISSASWSQTKIEGTIKNINNEVLIGASVVVQDVEEKKIIAYDVTDINGKYLLSFQKKTDSILLKVAFLGYKTYKEKLLNKNSHIDIQLKFENKPLKEVIIKVKAVEEKKDTITYKIKSLKKQEDQVIADVIKRIPGIEIKENGIIYYQGKAINKFYIENMDMLEGRYNLASNNLPIEQVASIQVFENHQPIKLLDSLTYSDRAAINIKLNKNFSYAFPAYISTGFAPVLWNCNITPLFFSKKRQALISYQSNNTGKDLQNEISDFSLFKEMLSTEKYLQIAQIKKPNYKKKWWLDNKTHLLTFNLLTSLSHSHNTKIKLNADYLYDVQKESSTSLQNIYLTSGNILLNESVINNYTNKKIKTAFVIEKNSKRTYLKNKFSYVNDIKEDNGYISNINTKQNVDIASQNIENNLYWLFPVGKQLIGINSLINYEQSNQSLEVIPIVLTDFFNQSVSYKQGLQFVSYTKWFIKNKVGFIKKINHFNIENDIKFLFKSKQMKSYIILEKDVNNRYLLNKNYQNDNDYDQLEFSDNIKISLKKNSWNFTTKIPIKLVHLRQNEKLINKEQRIKDVLINPSLWVSTQFNNFHWRFSVSKNNVYTNTFNNYAGKIWNMYNSLQQFNRPVNLQRNTNLMFLLNYKDVSKGFYTSLSASYTEKKKQYIYAYQFNLDGSKEMFSIAKQNIGYSNNFSFQFAKYVFKAKINFKLNITYYKDNSLEYINQKFFRFKSNNVNINTSIDFGLTKYLSMYLMGKLDYHSSSDEEAFFSAVSMYNFSGNIFFYPIKNHKIKFHFDYYENNLIKSKEKTFMNIMYHYKIPKKHLELNIEWRNITNKKEYIDIQSFENLRLENRYFLRPSQIILGLRFSL